MKQKQVSIVGAGIIGLSTGILAQDKGYKATIYTAHDPLQTTSAKAAASFKPCSVAYNALAHHATELSWERFAEISKREVRSVGVRLHTHWEANSIKKEEPQYLPLLKDVDIVSSPKVPGGYRYGWKYTTYFIDIRLYIPYLIKLFVKRGGKIVMLKKPFKNIDELAKLQSDIIFNCSGFGARQLCNDKSVVPVKGQIAVLEKISMDWSINADGFYIYPRRYDTILGGTYESNVSDENVESGALSLIITGNMRVLPKVSIMKVLRSYAGIRPYRKKSIRIEKEELSNKLIIHNYGHGGAGITLSWGSAQHALSLL